jgi:CHAD domain-containing protein
VAKARPIPGFAESASFREAAARTVEVRTEEVFEHAAGVLDVTDIERVHDMRVATRRLRAALEVYAKCFLKRDHRSVLKEVKSLADALGERRDRDVAIAGFEGAMKALTQADRPGIASLLDELRAEQAEANEVLAAAIARARDDGLHERLQALSAAAEPRQIEATA